MKNAVNVEKMFLEGAPKSEVLILVDTMYDNIAAEYKAREMVKRAFRDAQVRVADGSYTLEDLNVLQKQLIEKRQVKEIQKATSSNKVLSNAEAEGLMKSLGLRAF